ncbi:SDR family oxidoreductase [Streptacidiphilus sp. P02-A3a]|uniref:SDR family oxidoreductase n=1 Tax=Streptacidiphilus sp. P02-A3a TaxID=2704468 RepID=UPI0015F797C4|nr:NAD(P)H-binding protein [Streptacidiphilus sp. P02-A3a]QMU72067.1 SDR family oxidoreductase [Streptacidiphilus sp. P02-A3a]
MRFAVIGGTGRIGSRLVGVLNAAGHEAVPHARSTGVDLLTGAGLAQALAGAEVVIDVSQSPTTDDSSRAFFQTTMDHLLAAAGAAGVGHVVLLSIVGVDQVPGLGYYRAKVHQENLLKAGPIPYSIVRATQFFEFVEDVMGWTTDGDTVRLPATPMQPVAAADVTAALAEVALGDPLRGVRDIAGPDVFLLTELGRMTLAARGDGRRTVVTDDTAGPFAAVEGEAIIAGSGASLAPTHYRDWLKG